MDVSESELLGLRDLLAKQAIHELLMRYCRASDRGDVELLATTFWPEAVDDHGPYRSTVAEMLERRRSSAADGGPMQLTFMQHTIGNEYVTVDGDRARSETYFVSHHGCTKDGVKQVYVFGGRYLDRLERRAGQWRYAHRLVVCDWEGMQPATPGFWFPSPWVSGRNSTDDPVYELWADRPAAMPA